MSTPSYPFALCVYLGMRVPDTPLIADTSEGRLRERTLFWGGCGPVCSRVPEATWTLRAGVSQD